VAQKALEAAEQIVGLGQRLLARRRTPGHRQRIWGAPAALAAALRPLRDPLLSHEVLLVVLTFLGSFAFPLHNVG